MPRHPADHPEQRVVSGFWQRVLAFIIDGLLLGVVGILCGFFLFDQLTYLGGWGRLVGFSIALGYFGLLNSATGGGQTIGKRAMKIEVVDRAGHHISLGRSLLRYTVLGVPFFLNGILLPPSVMMSPIGYLIGFVLFAFGGAIIYLYLFNRHTRQSLHDLAVGTFVTKISPPGKFVDTVWRPHLFVVGTWLLAVVVLIIVMTGVVKKGVFSDLLAVQNAIQASGKVHVATVFVGKSWQVMDKGSSETTYLQSTAIWKQRPQDQESAARSVASIILRNYPEIMEKELLSVNIVYGYDIGISRAWKSNTSSHSPAEWRELVVENQGD
jgi:uncharacterized RDD family membrane protein YckC